MRDPHRIQPSWTESSALRQKKGNRLDEAGTFERPFLMFCELTTACLGHEQLHLTKFGEDDNPCLTSLESLKYFHQVTKLFLLMNQVVSYES